VARFCLAATRGLVALSIEVFDKGAAVLRAAFIADARRHHRFVKREIFFSDEDRTTFLGVLDDAVVWFDWLCHAYCPMGNHYHLLVETPEANAG
jgi:hypothetical protein